MIDKNSDFYIDFVVHPIKKDLAIQKDVHAISSAIKNLVFTNKYERPFAPRRGAGIPATLFENINSDTEYLLTTLIKESIESDEPRASNVKVSVVASQQHNSYTATIYYTPINTNTEVSVQAIFKRVR